MHCTLCLIDAGPAQFDVSNNAIHQPFPNILSEAKQMTYLSLGNNRFYGKHSRVSERAPLNMAESGPCGRAVVSVI